MNNGKRVLFIFRIGQLGDVLITLPVVYAIRAHFPGYNICMIGERRRKQQFLPAWEVFRGSGLVDEFMFYDVHGPRVTRMWEALKLFVALRKQSMCRECELVYLAPSVRERSQVGRDIQYFRICGIKKLYGASYPARKSTMYTGSKAAKPEVEALIERVRSSGIIVPADWKIKGRLRVNEADRDELERWVGAVDLPSDGRWVAIAPGSNMPAKRWPHESFVKLGQALIKAHGLLPITFGNAGERSCCEDLLRSWGQGYNAAGALSVRAAAALLSRCVLYVGNDTGTMHLAAAAGIRCVGIFSARDCDGRWNPIGDDHIVIRTRIDCEGCMQEVCPRSDNACLTAITVERVLSAVDEVMAKMGRYNN